MNKWIGRTGLLLVAASALLGCATSSGVLVNPNSRNTHYKSAYVVVHGDRSADMDANLEREFLRHGFVVSVGPDGGAAPGAQLIVRYTDDWKWDLKMYLRSLDVMVFDAKTNDLIATGSWRNSVVHGFYNSQKVVAKVVDDIVSKINVPKLASSPSSN